MKTNLTAAGIYTILALAVAVDTVERVGKEELRHLD